MYVTSAILFFTPPLALAQIAVLYGSVQRPQCVRFVYMTCISHTCVLYDLHHGRVSTFLTLSRTHTPPDSERGADTNGHRRRTACGNNVDLN
jgi:hypothetical protein